MRPIELLSRFRSLGIKLWADGDGLGYSAPPGALTPELRALLVAHKAEVLAFLRASSSAHPTPPPIRPAPRDERLPLSFAQQRLWFIDRMAPGIPSYNIPAVIRLSGQLNGAALRQSLDTIIRRHEVLRTTFAEVDGQPAQVIAAPAPLRLVTLDLSGLPVAEREAAARRTARVEAERSFDLARGPLVRATLVRLDRNEYLALFTVHHIISDGWSIGVLVRELAALYAAHLNGRPAQLPALPIQYADFAVWQRQWLQGDGLRSQLDYWRRQLGDHPPALDLPIARARAAVQTFAGTDQAIDLGAGLTAALNALSQREGATLFMTLLAGFDTLLYRYTGQADILIGTPIANRMRAEIEPLIGFFVNTLVLRADLGGNPTTRALLARVRETTLDAYAHQDLPFERLVEELRIERDMSRTPLFQVMLVLQNTDLEPLELPGLRLQPQPSETGTSRFDLTLALAENGDVLRGFCEYNTDLFDDAAITRLLAHYRTLLAGMAAEPDRCIGELPLLTAAERAQLLGEWNDTAAGAGVQASGVSTIADGCIHDLVERQAARTPDAIAVVFTTDDEGRTTNDERGRGGACPAPTYHLTYAELDRRANQLARYLRRLGVGPDVRVAISMQRSVELVLGVLGALKAGGAYVPLDPSYPAERLGFMLEHSGAAVVLTNGEGRTTNGKSPAFVVRHSSFVSLVADWPVIAREPTTRMASGAHAEHLAYVIYTSGSTGIPKGVAMTHGGLVNLLVWQLGSFRLAHPARTVQYSSPSFDVSFQEIFSTWCSGGTLVLVADELRRDPLALARFLNENAVERLFLPFVALQQLAEVVEERGLMPARLRELITAGEQLRLTQPILNWLSACAGVALHNHYGPSEAHAVTALALQGAPHRWPALPPIGRPLNNTQIYLLDRRLQPVPIGIAGELYVGGIQLARGYLDRPDLTAAAFVPNPFTTKDEGRKTNDDSSPSSFVVRPSSRTRLYKTGDLARYLPDGNIEFLGRADHQVKLRGYRIEPDEVAAVLHVHPSVRESCVLVREDTPGERRLVAYVIPVEGTADREQETATSRLAVDDEGGTVNDASSPSSFVLRHSSFVTELRGFLAERLPAYMVPTSFVTLAAWPLTPSGKLDRRALPAPDSAAAQQDTYQAPRDTLELRLARLWEELLGLAPIGVNDNFFTIGGHSLLIVRLLSRIEQQFGQRLPLSALFQEPTVAQLARALRQRSSSLPLSPLVPLRASGTRRPFFCVHPGAGTVLCYVELAQRLDASQPFYALQATGLEDEREPRTRVEQMAAAYLTAVREVQPDGPYLLGGWSFGGLVAFEMAQQLRAQGQQVALLALLDSWVPSGEAAPPPDELTLLSWFAQDLGRTFGKPAQVSPNELREVAPGQRLGYVLAQARAAGILPPDIDEARIARALSVFASNLKAMQEYRPQRYTGALTLLRASEQPGGASSDPTQGWGALAAGGIELHDIPGDHYSIVRSPHVQALAERLSACLDAVQTRAAELAEPPDAQLLPA